MKLYEFPAEFERLMEEITDCTDDGVLFDGLTAKLDQLESDFNLKVENCAKMVRSLTARATAFETEEKFFKAKRASSAKSVESLKDYIKLCMDRAGITEVQGKSLKVKLCDNGQPSLVIDNNSQSMGLIPRKFMIKQDPIPDKEAIKTALLEGKKLKFAELVHGKHVRIN